MLNASDDILNQINCTDSSGEDGMGVEVGWGWWNPPTNQKFAHSLREFWEHHYKQAWIILETEDSNQKIRKWDLVLA